MKTVIIPVAALLVLALACNPAQDSSNKTLESRIDSLFSNYNSSTPGCAVGVVHHGKIIFAKGYGMANLEYDVPITPATVFDIASVSKQFAGLAISTLVQEGKISLDDDVRKYVPEVPNFGKVITIRHLVHHTSGLRDWPEGLHAAGWRWDEAFTFQDIMRFAENQKDLDFEPGERYAYSNTGYNLLARVVEKVTNQTFKDWTDKNIFSPLEMNTSQFLDNHQRIIRNLAYSYSPGDVFLKNPTSLTAYGSSSLFTTVEDLGKWVIHFNKRLAEGDPIYTRMTETDLLNNGDTVRYGFGLSVNKVGGLKAISHTGGWAGYRTIVINFPDEELSLILLGNRSDFGATAEALRVARIVIPGKIKTDATTIDLAKEMRTISLDPEQAKKIAGTYQLGRAWFVTLTVEDGKLMTQANGEAKFPTFPKSDSVVWVEAYGSSMTFVTNENGEVNLLRYRGINAKRIIPLVTDVAMLSQYIGTYYSPELQTDYVLSMNAGKLVLRHFRLGEFDLSPSLVNPDAVDGRIGSLQFYREKGKVAGFKLSGGRIQNIRFEKR